MGTETEPFNVSIGEEAPADAKLIASFDIAGDYEVDEGTVHLLADGRIYYRYASGCSCWDGNYNSEAYDDFGEFLRMGIGQQYDRLAGMEFERGFDELETMARAARAA